MTRTTTFVASLGTLLLNPGTGVLIALLVVAAAIDWRSFRIPNWLTLSGTVYALVYQATHAATPFEGLSAAGWGVLLGFVLLLPLWLIRVIGAGDVKLFEVAPENRSA